MIPRSRLLVVPLALPLTLPAASCRLDVLESAAAGEVFARHGFAPPTHAGGVGAG